MFFACSKKSQFITLAPPLHLFAPVVKQLILAHEKNLREKR
jgi:hypothetical protein